MKAPCAASLHRIQSTGMKHEKLELELFFVQRDVDVVTSYGIPKFGEISSLERKI